MNVAEYESLHLPKEDNVIEEEFGNFASWVTGCVCARACEREAGWGKRKNIF